MEILLISAIAFVLSFIFALGGIGSALVLVPVLHWLGVPFAEARPTSLFVNTLSLAGASVSNLRSGRLDLRLGSPIIIGSIAMAPIAAYASTFIDESALKLCFIAFLFMSSSMMLKPKRKADREIYREKAPALTLFLIGALAGGSSGLLGVGGGGVVAPLMVLLGFNPKRIAMITALVVPFSSFTGFLAYWAMGNIHIPLVLCVGVAAALGGYLGTNYMQKHLAPGTVKKFLGAVIMLIGIKLLWQLF